jgi:membrane protein YdbS with pleckstrin-like domain
LGGRYNGGVSDAAPVAEAVLTDSVADGLDHPLDPRVIPLQQIGGSLFIGAFAFGSLIFLAIRLVSERTPFLFFALQLGVWLVAVLLGLWHAIRWPARAYQHTSYRVDDQGIEIRKGVYWRVVINVPRSRVQHIDVSQGPIERRYGLGTLVIYTAGTDHAKVELEGLEHGRALLIREHLLPSGAGDAV